MIGTVHSAQGGGATNTPAGRAFWENQEMHVGANMHIAEPNVTVAPYGTPPNPTFFQFPRQPVAGLRAVLGQLARTGIPRLPLGPPKVARMGQGNLRVGNVAPKTISRVQQLQPVASVEQTGAWYEYLS